LVKKLLRFLDQPWFLLLFSNAHWVVCIVNFAVCITCRNFPRTYSAIIWLKSFDSTVLVLVPIFFWCFLGFYDLWFFKNQGGGFFKIEESSVIIWNCLVSYWLKSNFILIIMYFSMATSYIVDFRCISSSFSWNILA